MFNLERDYWQQLRQCVGSREVTLEVVKVGLSFPLQILIQVAVDAGLPVNRLPENVGGHFKNSLVRLDQKLINIFGEELPQIGPRRNQSGSPIPPRRPNHEMLPIHLYRGGPDELCTACRKKLLAASVGIMDLNGVESETELSELLGNLAGSLPKLFSDQNNGYQVAGYCLRALRLLK